MRIRNWAKQGVIPVTHALRWRTGKYAKAYRQSIRTQTDMVQIFNTDQGAQFTVHAFTGRLTRSQIRISMDGRGRAFDNIFVERLWCSVKYENIYLKGYGTVPALTSGLHDYFQFYNHERPHQSLNYHVPAEVYQCG